MARFHCQISVCVPFLTGGVPQDTSDHHQGSLGQEYCLLGKCIFYHLS